MRAHDPGHAETHDLGTKRSADSNGRRRTLHGTRVKQARLLLLMLAVSVLGVFAPQPAGAVPLTTFDAGYCSGETFEWTGADQPLTVPAGATNMKIKAWGGGTLGDGAADGGAGGYVEGVLAVTPGTSYVVMTGSKGSGAVATYGFGSPPISANHAGAGLSGLFTGSAAVTATDMARAVLVAGGGGAGERTAGTSGGQYNGGMGGDPVLAGGNAGTMMGGPAVQAFLPDGRLFGSAGGSGGGYEGGVAHQRNPASATNTWAGGGGSNYVDASLTATQNLFTADNTAPDAPNNTDIHYANNAGQGYTGSAHPSGDGLVVVQFDDCTAAPVDSDGDGILDVDENPGEEFNSCLDPAHADYVAPAANDCDGDGVTVGDGDQDDADPCVDAAGAVAGCGSGPSEWSVTGGTTMAEGACVSYTIAMSAPVDSVATVDLGTSDNSTTSADYDTLATAVTAAVAAYAGPGTVAWDGTTLTFTPTGSEQMGPLTFSLCATTDTTVEGSETFDVGLTNPTLVECVQPELLARVRINGANDPTSMHNVVNFVTNFGSNGSASTWTDQGASVYTLSGGVMTNTTGGLSHWTYSDNTLPANEDGYIEFTLPTPLNTPNQLDIGWGSAQYPVSDYFITDFNSAQGGGVGGWRTNGQMAGFVGLPEAGQTTGSTPWLSTEAAGDTFRIAREGCDMKWYHNGTEVRSLTRAPLNTAGLIDPAADTVTTEITDAAVDSDGDGILDSDENPGEENDPCLDPTHADWVQLPTNDCDGDGSTVGDGDTDDADPCAAPGDTNWVELATNDCDGDGSTVGDGDTTDTDPCVDPSFVNWVALATNDCDGDGSTVGDGDTTDTDPCVDPSFANWVALATNDCDGDGVTVGGGDQDDFDVCVDAAGALASCVDSDGDGVTDNLDTDPNDPCVDPADAGWTQQATNDCDGDGSTVGDGDTTDTDPCVDPSFVNWVALATNDCDGDGSTVGDGDTTDTDPCVDPSFANWVALATNDCDGDGVTVGGGDQDDFDVCVDAAGALASCVDSDGDGVTDNLDTDPADPCVDPADAGWTQQATNDCDNDGTTVGGGDSVDTDPCVDFTTAPASNDCDGDGSTVGDGDTTDTDPCVDPSFANWVALATNDCDGDGVTVGAGDMDDFDVCIDAAGALASCVDSDGDGVTDNLDTDPADPCVDPADAGWTQQATNDCDNDGTTVGGGDSVDTDPCVDFTLAPASNDCDNDGVTVGAGDMDDMDPCVDSTGKICYEITGQVWYDVNQDGVRDAAESDISGVTLELYQGGVLIQSTVTASPYVFTDLAPGTYDVFVDVNTLPAWLTITFDADVNLDHIMTVTITNDDIELVDFGYAPQSLEGQLLLDGSPVPNQTVTIVDAAGNTFTVMTDANGMYELEGSLTTAFFPGPATVSAVVNGEQLSETVSVLGASVTNQDLAAGSPMAPPVLAFTGSNSTTLAQVGLAFLMAGLGLVAISSRREEDALLLEV